MPLRLVNWNVEWATPKSPRRDEILRRIRNHEPELVCLTEAHKDLLSQEGHTISSQADYGYPIKKGRRKVLLWSRNPWEQVVDLRCESLPPGRFVSAYTQTSVGEIKVVGACIPGPDRASRPDVEWNARSGGKTMRITLPVSPKRSIGWTQSEWS